MILMAIISIFLGILNFIMGLLPNLPEMPNVVKDGADYIFDLIVSATGFASYIFSPALLTFMLTAWLLLMNWEMVYNSFMWIIRKLPFLGSS